MIPSCLRGGPPISADFCCRTVVSSAESCGSLTSHSQATFCSMSCAYFGSFVSVVGCNDVAVRFRFSVLCGTGYKGWYMAGLVGHRERRGFFRPFSWEVQITSCGGCILR